MKGLTHLVLRGALPGFNLGLVKWLFESMALILVVTLLAGSSWSTVANAATGAPIFPEQVLLERIGSLQGQKLTSDAYKQKIQAIIVAYDESASRRGRGVRLTLALSQEGIMTPQQAQEFRQNIEHATKDGMANAQKEKPSQIIANAVAVVISANQGTQFAGNCGKVSLVGAIAVAGLVFSVLSYAQMTKNAYYQENNPVNSAVPQNNSAAGWFLSSVDASGSVLFVTLLGNFAECF